MKTEFDKQVFYVNLQHPWRKIAVIDVRVIECEKFVWVEDVRGQRRLLGASAFFTLASAERTRVSALARITAATGLLVRQPALHQSAWQELERIRLSSLKVTA